MVKLPQILTEQTTHDAVRSKHCDKEGMSLKSWEALDKPEEK